MRHIFIVGAKNIGQYGGYETFLDKLTEQHQDNPYIQYYVITKANGDGHMDETKLSDIKILDSDTFLYHNARVKKLHVPQIGSAQAVIYDVMAMKYCIEYCEKNGVPSPFFYVLACRMGPFFERLVKAAHKIGGKVYLNPDGHEWKRAKWNRVVRAYWKKSEQLMVKWADMLVCDSVNIEKYIQSEYSEYSPSTIYIAYGASLKPSSIDDCDPQYTKWLEQWHLKPGQYYMCCGRFVPENSFEIMIREFMQSNSNRDFVIITTRNDKLLDKLERELHFYSDPRIKFVGTVYDSQLLKKIRENAYANFHGHTVGGTNPSLLEALESTDVNLLIDVGFNREVAEDGALYWNKNNGNLASLINRVDAMKNKERMELKEKARERIRAAYSWEYIAKKYEDLWMEGQENERQGTLRQSGWA